MRNGYWVIRTYKAGRVVEKTKYWVAGEKPTRSKRKMKSDIKKQQHNGICAVRELARLLNANFKKGDILLGLDYSDAGYEKITNTADGTDDERELLLYRAAERELKLFIRRVSRACRERGIVFKYSGAVTSDLDGETGEVVRAHHHLVVNAEALSVCREKWALGGVHSDPLTGQADYTPIAEYLLRQVRHIENARKYVSSRNLERPIPEDRIAKNGAELRTPAGSTLVQRSEYRPDLPQYIRFIVAEKKSEGGGADV